MKPHAFLCAALCIAASTAASAQVHRCTDGAGRATYSDLPCQAGQPGVLVEPPRRSGAGSAVGTQPAAPSVPLQAPAETRAGPAQPAAQGAMPVALNGAAGPADTPACRGAQKELEFVSSIRTLPEAEKRARMNAAIVQANAHCGTNAPLLQEPARVVVETVPAIVRCDRDFCYDAEGALYRKSGPDLLTGPTGRTCARAGSAWNCR
ncbi:DUF4124 domain-containing protein [Acidovorax sp. NCPPB 4044]|uniref:DUF4124 domain-containing protein n=1 Tax=Acidovorax sp. NCPPB 4044 TaxID=2940490 RepID=UPI002303A101|nr:DUF4124 domain-containing protein [Acidovorax sp. NCPPB 4044]MDA8521844.1 DUF4124 domain-containing protein [Acidovorax sp. NCPPB 4044]